MGEWVTGEMGNKAIKSSNYKMSLATSISLHTGCIAFHMEICLPIMHWGFLSWTLSNNPDRGTKENATKFMFYKTFFPSAYF